MPRRKFMSKNCFSCTFGLIFQFTGLVGFPLTSLRCIHKGDVDGVNFSWWNFVSTIFIVISFAGLIVYFLNFAEDRDSDECTLLTTIAVCLIFSRYLQTIVTAVWKFRFGKTALIAMDDTVKSWKLLTDEDLLPAEIITSVRRRSLKIIAIVIAAPSIHILYASLTRFCSNPMFALQVSCGVGFYVDLLTTFGCEMLFDSLLTIMSEHHKNIKHYLEERLFRRIKFQYMVKNYIAFTTRLHIGNVWIFRYLQKFVELSFVLCLISSTATVTVNLYLTLTLILDANGFPACLITIQLQILISTVLMWRLVSKVNAITHLDKTLLTFLYKYPVSKISPEEAMQIEILIEVLNLKRPIMKAADIFVVRIKLLASIVGTTTTYVLVALQFHDL